MVSHWDMEELKKTLHASPHAYPSNWKVISWRLKARAEGLPHQVAACDGSKSHKVEGKAAFKILHVAGRPAVIFAPICVLLRLSGMICHFCTLSQLPCTQARNPTIQSWMKN